MKTAIFYPVVFIGAILILSASCGPPRNNRTAPTRNPPTRYPNRQGGTVTRRTNNRQSVIVPTRTPPPNNYNNQFGDIKRMPFQGGRGEPFNISIVLLDKPVNENNFVYKPNQEWKPSDTFDASNIPPWLSNLLNNFMAGPINATSLAPFSTPRQTTPTMPTMPTLPTLLTTRPNLPTLLTTKPIINLPTVPVRPPTLPLVPSTSFTTFSWNRISTFSTVRTTQTTTRPTTMGTTLSPLSAACGITKYSGKRSESYIGDAYIPSPLDRIVGGSDSMVSEMPWQVRIMSTTSRGTALCGGTLINNRAILTAAHCVMEQGASIRVVLGDYSIRNFDQGEQTLIISQSIVHPQYSTALNNNDFAILLLQRDVTFSDQIRPACLPKDVNNDFSNANCLISGWGRLSETNSKLPDSLQKASTRITPTASCKQTYSRGRITITSQMICAAAPGIDTCQGDSGGPLITVVNGRYTLIGVTSFGIGCGQSFPGVYSRVTAVLPWIQQNAGAYGTA